MSYTPPIPNFSRKNKTIRHIVFIALFILALITVFWTVWYVSGAPERYRQSIAPTAGFTLPVQKQPEYADNETSWARFPDVKPAGAWETPWGVDVFFVHGTTSTDPSGWNTPTTHQSARLTLEAEMLPVFAGPFEANGPVYAPLYRQATQHAMFVKTQASLKALELAYGDVKTAFEHYLEHQNQGRAVMLVGVEQGGLHAQRLLAEFFAEPDAGPPLSAAYIIESPIVMQGMFERFKVCQTAEDIGCVAAWNSVYADDQAGTHALMRRALIWTDKGYDKVKEPADMVCVNPALGTGSTKLAPDARHRGGVSAHERDAEGKLVFFENTVKSQCVAGYLVTSKPAESSLRRKPNEKALMTPADYNVFYADIQFDAANRARMTSAWLDENAPKPAAPLPPMESIEIAPIMKID